MPCGFDDADIGRFRGFTYVIRHLESGRQYVGRRFLWAKRGKKIVESNWRNYWGSCIPLLVAEKAQGKAAFERRSLPNVKVERASSSPSSVNH